MMYGPQKSDPRIVAQKPSNKPGRLGAEAVERRQGAEGNMVKPSMCRTLCRGSMSQGLDRARKRQRQGEGAVHRLLHHVTMDVLRAHTSGSTGAAPGVDGVTMKGL